MIERYTLVIVSIAGKVALKNCISGNVNTALKCLVITSSEEDMMLKKDFSGMTFIDVAALSVPVKRLSGSRACQTEYISYIENTCMLINPVWEASTISVVDQNEGLIEVAVNNKLREQGGMLAMLDDLSTCYSGEDVHSALLSTCRQHGRLYAGKISSGNSLLSRVVMFAKAMLLPVVLSLRGIRYSRGILKASDQISVVAWIICMETSWSIGEASGYLFGVGKSIEAWG